MRRFARILFFSFLLFVGSWETIRGASAQRLVVLKVDGLGFDLLTRVMQGKNPQTGRPNLPWIHRVFDENGVIFDSFYTRGISLSTPSWSMLDTGHHLLIKGNVEYDRYTGRVYDYLNFFPFYLGYARMTRVDMPAVEVLDAAGVPLLSDAFPYEQRDQSVQLYQRGVRWPTLQHSLQNRFSTRHLLSLIEDPQAGIGLSEGLAKQSEKELLQALKNPEITYLDYFTGEIDHVAHSVNDPKMLGDELAKVDALIGRIWSAIEDSPLAGQTVFAVVSDHGMNNVAGIYSQTFSLPDLLNSPEGGAHHVVTNRHQLDQFKLAGLDPLVSKVVNESTASFYLQGQASKYPTAWLDLDGNERASVSLRNSDLNEIHILLQQLSRKDLPPRMRHAVVSYFEQTMARLRPKWNDVTQGLQTELDSLRRAIAQRETEQKRNKRKWSAADRSRGLDKEARRKVVEASDWRTEAGRYANYLDHLKALLSLHPPESGPLRGAIETLVPERSLGDPNDVYNLQHYVVGPSSEGLVMRDDGTLDGERSFRRVNYFQLLASQRARNNPQPAVPVKPVDFVATALPCDHLVTAPSVPGVLRQAIWIYGDEEHQIVELVSRPKESEENEILLIPIAHLRQSSSGVVEWDAREWTPGFPLELFEDPQLTLQDNAQRVQWLSGWHSERDWFRAIYKCRYSNGVIGLTEEFLPPSYALPAHAGEEAGLHDLELRRRQLVQTDFEVFAADHWNFNVRNFNPGGNHGSFLTISTHSVWMMAGAGIPRGKQIQEPYDSLNFGSTLLHLVNRLVPLPGRVVNLDANSNTALSPVR